MAAHTPINGLFGLCASNGASWQRQGLYSCCIVFCLITSRSCQPRQACQEPNGRRAAASSRSAVGDGGSSGHKHLAARIRQRSLRAFDTPHIVLVQPVHLTSPFERERCRPRPAAPAANCKPGRSLCAVYKPQQSIEVPGIQLRPQATCVWPASCVRASARRKMRAFECCERLGAQVRTALQQHPSTNSACAFWVPAPPWPCMPTAARYALLACLPWHQRRRRSGWRRSICRSYHCK